MYHNSGTFMTSREYIAYSGHKFTIEWYFDARGQSQALDYFNDLDEGQQDKLIYLMNRLGDIGAIKDKTKFRNEGDGVYAFKPKPDRFLCFFVAGKKVVITNAFEKKQDKLPKNEKERALRNMDDYKKRTAKEAYYE